MVAVRDSLLKRPDTTSLVTCDHLDPRDTRILTTYGPRVLSSIRLRSQSRHGVHDQLPSHHGPRRHVVPPKRLQRYGVSTETIRKWRKRGISDCLDPPPGRTGCPGGHR